MHKYLEKESEISFDKIFNQILGKYLTYYVYLLHKNIHLCLKSSIAINLIVFEVSGSEPSKKSFNVRLYKIELLVFQLSLRQKYRQMD